MVRAHVIAAAMLVCAAALPAQAQQAQTFEPIKLAVVDGAIPKPLTDKPGDPAAGRKAVIGRALGNCLACHQMSALKDEDFHGEFGPPLDGVAQRYNEGQLRLLIANPKLMFPETTMPAFYRNDGFTRVRGPFIGKPILTAQQVEDVVAYLKTLN